MGNAMILLCPASELQQLTSLALDICPVHSHTPNSLIDDMLVSPKSSLHLSDRYRDVQNSLSPSEQSHFSGRLRSTFGREGKVTTGGAGVVALALAMLFDTLAKEVKGQWVPESGPIPGLFLHEPGRTPYAPVLLVSEYLRLVPHIANNLARMREETEKYLHKLEGMKQTYKETFEREGISFVSVFNSNTVWKCAVLGLQKHHEHLSNSTSAVDLSWLDPMKFGGPPHYEMKSSFNCDLEAANTAFKQEVPNSYKASEELLRCMRNPPEGLTGDSIPNVENMFDKQSSVLDMQDLEARAKGNLVAAEEYFDLKAKSHLPF